MLPCAGCKRESAESNPTRSSINDSPLLGEQAINSNRATIQRMRALSNQFDNNSGISASAPRARDVIGAEREPESFSS